MKKVIETLYNIYKIEDLRNRVFLTLTMLLVYRIGAQVVLPGIDPVQLSALGDRAGGAGLLGILNALPVWRTEDGKETKVIGSVNELIGEIETAVAQGIMKTNPFGAFQAGDLSDANYDQIDLHKNSVDEIVLYSQSGLPMYRESDLIDVWKEK